MTENEETKEKETNKPTEYFQPIPFVAVAIMLIVAVFPLPEGYYTALRIFVLVVSGYAGYKAYQWKKTWAIWLFVALAVLFNPFIPVTFTKQIWQVLDVIAAFIFGLSLILITSKKDKDKTEESKTSYEDSSNISNKSRLIVALLAFFFGYFGAHNFYAGRWLRGSIQLPLGTLTIILMIVYALSSPGSSPFPFFMFSSAIIFVWVAIEFAIALKGNYNDSEGKWITRWF